jgi:hypothetical protein
VPTIGVADRDVSRVGKGMCPVSRRVWGAPSRRDAGMDPECGRSASVRRCAIQRRGAIRRVGVSLPARHLVGAAGPVWTWQQGLHLTGAANERAHSGDQLHPDVVAGANTTQYTGVLVFAGPLYLRI